MSDKKKDELGDLSLIAMLQARREKKRGRDKSPKPARHRARTVEERLRLCVNEIEECFKTCTEFSLDALAPYVSISAVGTETATIMISTPECRHFHRRQVVELESVLHSQDFAMLSASVYANNDEKDNSVYVCPGSAGKMCVRVRVLEAESKRHRPSGTVLGGAKWDPKEFPELAEDLKQLPLASSNACKTLVQSVCYELQQQMPGFAPELGVMTSFTGEAHNALGKCDLALSLRAGASFRVDGRLFRNAPCADAVFLPDTRTLLFAVENKK